MKTAAENTQFNKLCELLNLGAMVESPKSIAGGLLHKMYLVETTKGCYAVKALNPSIIQRPTALPRYIQSERIAEMAAREIPALPARKFKEKFFAFAESYAASYGFLYADWEEVLFGSLQGKLQWLEYSLKRSLRLECADEEEQSLGTTQVTETINGIIQYVEMIPAIQGWITECFDAQGGGKK